MVCASDASYESLVAVHWCPGCARVLDESEVAQPEHTCDDIYFRFDLTESSIDKLMLQVPGAVGRRVSLVAWTTTPWSLPANTALAVGPDISYQFVLTAADEVLVVAKPLRNELVRKAGLARTKVIGEVPGRELEHLEARYPLEDRSSPVVLWGDVLPTAGTAIVHIAPGLGEPDFSLGRANRLDMISPFEDDGTLSAEAGEFAGMSLEAADAAVIERLRERDALLANGKFVREYPHCAACGHIVLDRIACKAGPATER
jgi:isoleucyl-tRNA synthetase